uniref:Uncharacterized protein n=1 Tax=Tetranychus urticae TaxID=32264 RepID=T1KR76_TETUR
MCPLQSLHVSMSFLVLSSVILVGSLGQCQLKDLQES